MGAHSLAPGRSERQQTDSSPEMTSSNYTRDEEDRLVEELRAGRTAVCPRCGGVLSDRRVQPPDAVPYVRDRVWLTCEGCRRSVVLDRRRFRTDP